MGDFAERIGSVAELVELASSPGGVACFIFLNFGGRSSKHVWYRDRRVIVLSEIDGAEESAPVGELGGLGSGFLLEAIEAGAFYQYVQGSLVNG